MSEMAPEAPAPRRRENVLTRKLGPLPTWVWVVIAAGILIAYAWWHNRNTQQNQPSSAAGQGQVPQFVNQTFVQPEPPEPPESAGPEGPPGPPGPPGKRGRPPHEPPPPHIRGKHHKGNRHGPEITGGGPPVIDRPHPRHRRGRLVHVRVGEGNGNGNGNG